MDVGCYCISGSRLLGGEPESVFGRAYIGPTGTDWAFTGSLRFPGDVLALFDCATCLPNRDELEAIGSDGSLFLDDPWHCQNPVIELRREDGVERIEMEAGQSVPARARGSRQRDPQRHDAAARARRRRRAGARDRRAAPLGGRRPGHRTL